MDITLWQNLNKFEVVNLNGLGDHNEQKHTDNQMDS